jgi:hypothetical protein
MFYEVTKVEPGVPSFGSVPCHENTTDWFGRFRPIQDSTNDYQIDRELQRTKDYTGIRNIHVQDKAITELMGPVLDRSREHLGTSDVMVIRIRRRMAAAAIALVDDKVPAPGVDTPDVFRVRSGGVILPEDADWLEATRELINH